MAERAFELPVDEFGNTGFDGARAAIVGRDQTRAGGVDECPLFGGEVFGQISVRWRSILLACRSGFRRPTRAERRGGHQGDCFEQKAAATSGFWCGDAIKDDILAAELQRDGCAVLTLSWNCLMYRIAVKCQTLTEAGLAMPAPRIFIEPIRGQPDIPN